MRKAFILELLRIAKHNKKVVLLTADLGFMVLEPFRDQLPKQFLNVGVMEQNMVGVASGLAMNGYIPFLFSITTFLTLRSFEFIRNGPSAHALPVRIIGIGSGVEYSYDGLTHHAYEDLGVMRMLPNVSIIVPGDSEQAKTALQKTWNRPEPIYYRISKNEGEPVPNLNGKFAFGRLNIVRRGDDCLLLAHGTMALEAYKTAELLAARHISCTVAVISTLQPVPTRQLAELAKQHKLAVTMEAHYPTGGIGTILAEVIAQDRIDCKLVSLGLDYAPQQRLGDLNYFYTKHGLTPQQVADTVEHALNRSWLTSFAQRFF